MAEKVRVKQERKKFGDLIVAAAKSYKDSPAQVSAPAWGTVLRLNELLEMFLVDGKYDLGKGDIVVPPNIDFRHAAGATKDYWKLEITEGFPYFIGRGIVKLVDTLSGKIEIKAIQVHNDCKSGEVIISNFVNYPFTIVRS